ncbi:MAG: insulinase family protein [Clostridia bacterium]|nr:insulinase family protein [Clostridia bacterium]
MSRKKTELAKGVEGLFVKNERFNTTLISCNFYLPLRRDTAALYALLPFILTSCSKRYPDFSRLNYKLNRLYGARLDASAEKYGDYQLLKMSVSVINDRFTLDGESLIKQAVDLLLGLIFEPNTENGAFCEDDLAREKRKAIEHIKGEYSEKRIYAKNRLVEEMFKDTPYGVPKCGTVEDVEKITGEALYSAWQKMLETAFVRLNVIGAAIPQGLFDSVSEKFSALSRESITDCRISQPTPERETPLTVTEGMDVSQGKLVMGFSCDMCGNDDETLPLMVMSDIFGGGPYSRLFANVREKLSLCYYCSSSVIRQKGLLTVESGVETANAEKAKEEILNQLEAVKKGEFTDFEFDSSIKSIRDSLCGYSDSQTSLDTWYTLKVNNTELYSPTDIAERIEKITREDVTAAAKGVKLNTVYKLLPKEVSK